MLKDAVDFTKLRRVLVVKLRHHGDVLLSSPVFTTLHNHYPHLEVDALVYQETAEMLSLHPGIAQLHTIDRNWKRQGLGHLLAREWALLKRLRTRDYDLLVMLTEQWRGAWLKRLLGIPYGVVAEYGRRRSRFWRTTFTHRYPETHRRHKVEFHLDALRRLGLDPDARDKQLLLGVAEEDRRQVERLLAEEAVDRPYIVLHPASRCVYKCWEVDKYAALMDRLIESGQPVVLTGAPTEAERRMIAAIKAAARHRPVDLSGRLSLKQLGALIERASCFVGVDSMPMHLAAAVATPVVALFGPSSQYMWHPWCDHYEIVSSRPTCQPCFQHGCGNSEVSDCIRVIPVEAVYAAVWRMLNRCPRSVAAPLIARAE